jgi:hypothetical protein
MRHVKTTLVAALASLAIACSAFTPVPVPPTPPPVVTPPIVEPPIVEPPVIPPLPVGRRGAVRLEGRAFADADGPWLATGTTLFWALWGERHDPERLEQNLAWLANEGGDYVRILGMVGTESWADRRIDPNDHDYWDLVRKLDARLERHGLRFQITVFADAQAMMPNKDARPGFLDRWVHYANAHPHRVTMIEIANEYWQNGLDLEELVTLTKRANAATSVLVASSAPGCGTFPEGETPDAIACRAEWAALGAVSDLMGPHFDRDISKADGVWRPVRQPWEMLFTPPARAYINNEPIGPQSSVAADDGPGRMMMAAAVTWLTGGAAYTLHTGAGIRGGGQFDRDRGRSANLWEVPRISDTWSALRAVRTLLPPTLPNCAAKNAHWGDAPLSVDPDTLVRAYQAVCPDGTIVALPFGVRDSGTVLTTRVPLELNGRTFAAGESIPINTSAAVWIGRLLTPAVRVH